MSVKSFKFVSPGVFVNEVDNSQMARLPDATGPVIIGRAERGPAMVPIKVESFSEFVEIFGAPIAGGAAADAWRDGNRLGPTYGAFAAQAYLKNGSPITFVRLLGEKHPDATAESAKAGWKTTAAYALKVKDNTDTFHLAAIIYSNGQKATPTAPTIPTTGNILLHVPVANTAMSAGTAATQSIVFTGANIDNGDSIKLYQLDTENGTSQHAVTVSFANTSSTNKITSGAAVPVQLEVGTGNVSTVQELVDAIKDGINQAGAAVKLTASVTVNATDATHRDLVLVNDVVGAMDGVGRRLAEEVTDGNNIFSVTAAANPNGADSAAGSTNEESFVVNFDPNSKKYIRKILNTNPTTVNTRDSMSTENYFLGQTFDQHIKGELGTISGATLTPLYTGGLKYGNYAADAKASKTPWVLSQFMGDYASKKTASQNLAVSDLTKLFRLHSLYAGDWEQKNFKISIAEIKPSDRFSAYGTFSVLVRDASDSDDAPIVRERFSNCNLDPSSENYIGRKIGDMQQHWEEDERRYRTTGSHPNMSKYIRVEVASAIETGEANAEFLPFGFAAPLHANNAGIAAGEVPLFRFRESTEGDSNISQPTDAFFGISTGEITQDGAGNDIVGSNFDPSYQDLVKPFYGEEDMYAANGALFSLDLIKRKDGTDLVAGTSKHATFEVASADAISDGSSINAFSKTPETVLEAGFDRFTLPLAGGLDGLDIVEVEPFCDKVLADKTAITSAPYNTLSKAIDTVADPEVVECNLMAIPGVSNKALTGKLISVCERRGDALAIIDLEGDYTPTGWDNPNNSAESRLPDVDAAISKLKFRALSSSYGCAFFPWVQVNDQINNKLVWMPPSVVALGTMASSAANSELWFAPAGFTRGGLSNGAGGLPVSQVRLRLNSKQRDKLYDAGINPIAQFPAEGIVVFGQKTLQMTPSALDRINVRRLMIFVKKEISRMASTVLFDQNVETTWQRFLSKAEPFLGSVKSRFGLSEYRIILDDTTTTPELIDRNIVYAKVFLKPSRAIEFIAVDFVITNSGASFDD